MDIIGGLRLRKADLSDLRLLYEWRNDPECVCNSATGKQVEWSEHQRWFASIQKGCNAEIFILETEHTPLGQVRLNLEEHYGVISYSIAKEYRRQRLGREILIRIEEEAKKQGIQELRAEVKKDNTASRKLFLELDYEEVLNGDMILYRKR